MDNNQPKANSGLIGWFASNSVTANLLMIFLVVGGLWIASNMKTEAFPTVDPNSISITVPYPGATPLEIEQSVTIRMEEALSGIEGVDRIRSTSNEGSSNITLELKDFIDRSKVKDEATQAIDQIADFPPVDAEEPSISITEPTSEVMKLVVFGSLDPMQLRQEAEQLRDYLLRDTNISLVNLQGVRDYEISISVSDRALREHTLTLQDVANAVQRASVDLSAGQLETEAGRILLQTNAERREGREFSDVIITSDPSGAVLRLSDIAEINDGFSEGQIFSNYDGKPAVYLAIGAGDDQDAFDIASAVEAALDVYVPSGDARIEILSDDTVLINDRLNLLIRNSVLGLMLVFVLLALFLDLRLAFWTTLGIPISFLGAFWIIGQFTTINMMTLFGLIVVLGIVVDDAVVVGENIYEAQSQGGHGFNGALKGTLGVLAPVTIGVLTSIAAFAPLLFSTGTLGQILYPVPIVVIAVLGMSLIEAFLILPAHLAHGGEWSVGPMKRLKNIFQSGLASVRDRVVIPFVQMCVRARYISLAVGVSFLIIMVGFFQSGVIRFIFFPNIEGDTVSVSLEMVPGTPFAATDSAVVTIGEALDRALGEDKGQLVDSLSTISGGRTAAGFGPGSGGTVQGENLGQVTLYLFPSAQRDISADEIARKWQEEVGRITGAKSLSFVASAVGGGADVSFDLSHPDGATLERIVRDIAGEIGAIDGVVQVRTGADEGTRQLLFELTDTGVAAGLTTQDIATQLRQAVFGQEVQRIQRGRDEVRVFVRLPLDERNSLADLSSLRLRLIDGTEMPLSTAALITETTSPSSIVRVDGLRRISVEIDIDESRQTPNELTRFVNTSILTDYLEEDRQLSFSLEGQGRDQQEELQTLASNLLVALMLIYVMLASVLRSYFQPLIIMSAIPFAAACAILGHMIMGYDVSFLSLFGIVALSGVIINDSVVLIDHFNRVRREEAIDIEAAAIQSVQRRFRPIMLTTLTTFLGLLPMLLETSLQAQFLIPMAISLGFGILFAGILILPLVPILLVVGNDIVTLPRRLKNSFQSRYGENHSTG